MTNNPALSSDKMIIIRASAAISLPCLMIIACLWLVCRPVNTVSDTETPIAISQEGCRALEAKLENLRNDPRTRRALRITQDELTSYLALKLTDSPFEAPRIRIKDERIHLTGTFTGLLFAKLSLFVVLKVSPGEDGPGLALDEARLGALPIPKAALSLANLPLKAWLKGWKGRVSWRDFQIVDSAIQLTIQ